VWRWLAADPRDVVDLAGAGTVGADRGDSDLSTELRHWRRVVSRRRLVVLLRRHGGVALGLAALLEILALLGAFPQWVVVAVPLAALVVSVSVTAARGPAPFELARLLDDKLGLNDRLATALEIEAHGGGARSPLEGRTVADAAALLASGREDWRASAVPAGRDGWALAAPLAALAIVIVVGAITAGSSSSGPVEALGRGAGGGTGNSANEHRRAKAEKAKREQHLAPTGKLHKLQTKKGPPPSAEQSVKGGYRQIPQGKKTEGKEEKGNPARGTGKGGTGKAPTGKLHKNSGATNGEEKHGEEKTPPGTDKQPGGGNETKKKQKIGFNLKNQKHGAHSGNGPSQVSGASGNKPGTGKNGKLGGESAAAESNGRSGTPTGAGKAGGEEGSNQAGHATPIKGKASQAVRIQPGYAPSRSTKGGAEKHKTGTSQGTGGKARTARVTGATQVGDEFSYVPAAGGAVPGPSAGLQQNYLESLKWVERLPW
jgi:hypothetical protein